MTTILAIDQGTSGTKAIVVNPARGALATAEEPVRPAYLGAGAVEQDPGQLLSSVLTSGRRALQAAGRTADVITLANQGETVLAWDPATGTPLSPAIGWQDRRAEKLCAEPAGPTTSSTCPMSPPPRPGESSAFGDGRGHPLRAGSSACHGLC